MPSVAAQGGRAQKLWYVASTPRVPAGLVAVIIGRPGANEGAWYD